MHDSGLQPDGNAMNTSGSTGNCVDKKVRVQPCEVNPYDCVDIAWNVVWGDEG